MSESPHPRLWLLALLTAIAGFLAFAVGVAIYLAVSWIKSF
jgi:hypothetical protein